MEKTKLATAIAVMMVMALMMIAFSIVTNNLEVGLHGFGLMFLLIAGVIYGKTKHS